MRLVTVCKLDCNFGDVGKVTTPWYLFEVFFDLRTWANRTDNKFEEPSRLLGVVEVGAHRSYVGNQVKDGSFSLSLGNQEEFTFQVFIEDGSIP